MTNIVGVNGAQVNGFSETVFSAGDVITLRQIVQSEYVNEVTGGNTYNIDSLTWNMLAYNASSQDIDFLFYVVTIAQRVGIFGSGTLVDTVQSVSLRDAGGGSNVGFISFVQDVKFKKNTSTIISIEQLVE
jgi:hypothetical protein